MVLLNVVFDKCPKEKEALLDCVQKQPRERVCYKPNLIIRTQIITPSTNKKAAFLENYVYTHSRVRMRPGFRNSWF